MKVDSEKLNLIKSILLLLMLIGQSAYSQSPNELTFLSKLSLLENVEKYSRYELGMDLSENFFSQFSKTEDPNYYLYVSRNDTLASPLNVPEYLVFGHDYDQAILAKSNYDKLGHSTLLYKTYGTSNTKISDHLLSYSKESITFIAFHEATHQHVRSKGRIPYAIEEATCDLIGNYGTLKLFKKDKTLKYGKAKKHLKQIEDVALTINELIEQIERKNKADFSLLKKHLRRFKKDKSAFKLERYDYEINHAYLLRNRSYTLYYFKLKHLLSLNSDIKTFLDFVVDLPNNELESVLEIDNEIQRLKDSGAR